jgi:hypothetical protein
VSGIESKESSMSESNPPPGGGYGSPPPGGGYGAPPPGGGYGGPPPGGGYGGPPPGGGYGSAPPPPPGGYGPGGYGAPQTDQKAVWALVLGILGVVCCGFFTGIPALILGKSSQKSIDASGGRLTGRGMATAGFVLGIISIVFGLIGLALLLTGNINYNFSTSP